MDEEGERTSVSTGPAPVGGKKRRRVGRGCAAAIVGLILLPVILEIGVRLLDPLGVSHFFNMKRYMSELVELRPDSDRIAVHRPNMHLDLHGWDVFTNSYGLRGPDLQVPKPEGVRRVLFVGDSVTFGWGVDDEDTFVRMVERDLNQRGEQRWESVNAGHLYHDSTQERAVLEEVGMRYEPDVVVLVFVGNDIHPTREMLKPAAQRPVSLTAEDLEEIRIRQAAKARIAWMGDWMPFTHRLFELFLTRYQNYRFRQKEGNAERDPYMLDRAGIDTELGWSLAQRAILRMREVAEGGGARFVVLDTGRMEELEAFCHSNGIEFHRIVHSSVEKEGTRNSVSDPHQNRKGHRHHADKILRVLDGLPAVEPD